MPCFKLFLVRYIARATASRVTRTDCQYTSRLPRIAEMMPEWFAGQEESSGSKVAVTTCPDGGWLKVTVGLCR